MIGLDPARSVFQVHAEESAEHMATRRKLLRGDSLAFLEQHEAFTVVMEACEKRRVSPSPST